MTLSRRGLIAAAGLLVPASSSLAQDRLPPVSIRRSELTVSRSLAVARPDLPVPSDSGMLFYVQHAINKNVLVYAARQRPDGALDPQAPVEVFWRRYDDDNGRRRELSFFERVFAFGVSAQPLAPSRYSARIAGYRERDATIDLGADGKPRALMTSGQRTFRIVYAYAQAEDRRFIPKIHHIDIHGIDVASGEAVRERVRLDM
ncbi:MAG: DUF4833 domain-containing protein [Phreatobacter sp.]|jgi:hypothetical protein|uniref:DUF4833 domain-containing protein n=1 Tax=Phreatobacter sp. TaxID=1966341 RepID=UPI0040352107